MLSFYSLFYCIEVFCLIVFYFILQLLLTVWLWGSSHLPQGGFFLTEGPKTTFTGRRCKCCRELKQGPSSSPQQWKEKVDDCESNISSDISDTFLLEPTWKPLLLSLHKELIQRTGVWLNLCGVDRWWWWWRIITKGWNICPLRGEKTSEWGFKVVKRWWGDQTWSKQKTWTCQIKRPPHARRPLRLHTRSCSRWSPSVQKAPVLSGLNWDTVSLWHLPRQNRQWQLCRAFLCNHRELMRGQLAAALMDIPDSPEGCLEKHQTISAWCL